jgi:hypothetical protein
LGGFNNLNNELNCIVFIDVEIHKIGPNRKIKEDVQWARKMESIPAGFGMANEFETEDQKEDGFCPRISIQPAFCFNIGAIV